MASFFSNGKRIGCKHVHPAGPGPHPAVVLLHGSGGGVQLMQQASQMLALAGYSGFAIEYFQATGHSWVSPQMIRANFDLWMRTVREGISYISKLAEVDPRRIALVGFSLGAYLSLSVAAEDERVSAVVDVFGGIPDEIAARFQSGELKRYPPTLVLHGEEDPVVPVAEAHKLEKLLKGAGVPFEINIYPGQGHTLRGPAQLDALLRIHNFLDRHLKTSEPAARAS